MRKDSACAGSSVCEAAAIGVSRMSPKCVSSRANALTCGPKCSSISCDSEDAEAKADCAMSAEASTASSVSEATIVAASAA